MPVRYWLFSLLLASLAATQARAQVYYLSLDKQALEVPDRSFYIEQVLDGRTDRAGLGLVRPPVGLIFAASPRPADLRPNLVAGLTQFLQAQLPMQADDHPALLLVRELRVGELVVNSTVTQGPAGLQTGSSGGIRRQARATLDLYLHATDGYHFVQTATDTVRPSGLLNTTAEVANSGISLMPSHERNLQKVLERCLRQFAAADWAAAQHRPAQSLAALTQVGHVAANLDYNILADTAQLTPGYYPTFLAFRNNKPVPVPTLRVRTTPREGEGWEDLPQITPLWTVDGKERTLPLSWGFTDGQHLYIQRRGYYRQLARQGNAFNFMGPLETAKPGLDPGRMVETMLNDHRPVAYTLDLLMGRVTQFADAGRPATRTDTARILVYRTGGAGPAQPVFLNDQLVGELAENQCLQLPWSDPAHEPRLRLGAAPGPELAFIPNFREPIYVRVVRRPEPEKVPLELVPAQVGVFDIKKLKLRARK